MDTETLIPDLETPAVSTAEGPIDILAKYTTDFIANSINANTPSWLTGIGTSIIGLIGLFTSTLSAWRKEKREAQNTDLQHEKAKLEIERKEIELERRELKFEKEKFNSEKDKTNN